MMGQPEPEVALNNICSAIHNNTLYTYSPDAFQSLSLDKGASWKSLPSGVVVTGGVCVGSTPTDDSQAGFYVIGGTTNSSDDYNGLQKFTYATGTWESLTPVTAVTKDRLNHGAVYINSSDAILMYAGSQEGNTNPSTQTFSIAASAPYSVLAYMSSAPPAVSPILLPWSDSQAVMVGGSADNRKVMLFTVDGGWVDSGASLAAPLKTDSEPWRASLVTGDDGSKNLYTFDMTKSPNEANRTVLIDGTGAPVTDSVAITKRSEALSERNTLTVDTWPTYNNTYASTATRNNYAAAADTDGQVVLAGGNTEDVLCIFDGKSNAWVNATAKLSDQMNLVFSASSSSVSATATATSSSVSVTTTATSSGSGSSTSSTAAASTTAAAAASSSSSSSGLSTNSVLGVVLGSVGGAFVLLLLVYCQIRKRKRTQDFIQAGHARRSSGVSREPEKDGMAMATDSYPRSPTNPTFARSHQQKGSTASFSSMAILMGKIGHQKQSMDQPRPSMGARHIPQTTSSYPKDFKSSISSPFPPEKTEEKFTSPPRTYLAPEAREEKGVSFAADTVEPQGTLRIPADQQEGLRRSSGWNRYWSGDSALNILGYGGNGGDNGQQKNRDTLASEGSHYSSTNNLAVSPQTRNRITQDSATVPPLNVVIGDGRPRFSRVNSGSPSVESYSPRVREFSGQLERRGSRDSDLSLSGYSSGIPPSVNDTWDPTSANKWEHARAPSSAYRSSYASTAFPMPPVPAMQQPPVPSGRVPSGISNQPVLKTAHTSDMSWLNLGEQKQQQQNQGYR